MTGRILQNSNVIEVRQGDSFTIRLQFKKGCEVIDLTSSRVTMQVRNEAGDVLLDKLATEVDLANGKVALILTPSDTSFEVGDYNTDIQIEMPDGSINTIFPADVNRVGIFRITEQVTR